MIARPPTFLMSPDQHRRQAARLRASGDPNLLALAEEQDQLAAERRLNMTTPSPST